MTRTVDLKEPRLLLLVLAELQLVHIILQTEFLKSDGDLVAVGSCSIAGLARTFGWVLCRLDVCFSPLWTPIVERMSGDSDEVRA